MQLSDCIGTIPAQSPASLASWTFVHKSASAFRRCDPRITLHGIECYCLSKMCNGKLVHPRTAQLATVVSFPPHQSDPENVSPSLARHDVDSGQYLWISTLILFLYVMPSKFISPLVLLARESIVGGLQNRASRIEMNFDHLATPVHNRSLGRQPDCPPWGCNSTASSSAPSVSIASLYLSKGFSYSTFGGVGLIPRFWSINQYLIACIPRCPSYFRVGVTHARPFDRSIYFCGSGWLALTWPEYLRY